ncbi:MAG: hypothetical protein DYG89_02970 [Caldilinea sp. CFX5]|nr:hypothetical protein [Caldilinea sp. CFX5]
MPSNSGQVFYLLAYHTLAYPTLAAWRVCGLVNYPGSKLFYADVKLGSVDICDTYTCQVLET